MPAVNVASAAAAPSSTKYETTGPNPWSTRTVSAMTTGFSAPNRNPARTLSAFTGFAPGSAQAVSMVAQTINCQSEQMREEAGEQEKDC
jgi:hypothetical protein